MRRIALHAAILFPTESVMEAPDGDCNASVNTALVKAHHVVFFLFLGSWYITVQCLLYNTPHRMQISVSSLQTLNMNVGDSRSAAYTLLHDPVDENE